MNPRAPGIGAAAAATAMSLIALVADAADLSGASRFSFSGFGTLGVVHSSEDRADFAGSIFQPNGAGFSRSWSPEVDSRVGAQFSVRFTPELSAVVQLIAEQNYDGTFRPRVEWANLKYQLTPDLSVRVGRVELPTFLFSDSRKVGYTYAWIRPPTEVYSVLPITASDGAGLSYRMNFGDVSNTTQSSYVQSNTPQPGNRGSAVARDSINFANTTEFESLSFRVSYQHARLTITSLDGFLNAFKMFGAQGIAIADEYNSDGKTVVTEVIGASYNRGGWFAISEWVHSDLNSFLGDVTAWYASAGLRVGPFTPYVTYAHEHAAKNSDPGLTVADLPPGPAAYASGLNAALNTILQSIPDQSTVSVGARWDFTRNFDLKLQADHTRRGADSFGALINIQPGLRPGGTLTLFSAAVDFVF